MFFIISIVSAIVFGSSIVAMERSEKLKEKIAVHIGKSTVVEVNPRGLFSDVLDAVRVKYKIAPDVQLKLFDGGDIVSPDQEYTTEDLERGNFEVYDRRTWSTIPQGDLYIGNKPITFTWSGGTHSSLFMFTIYREIEDSKRSRSPFYIIDLTKNGKPIHKHYIPETESLKPYGILLRKAQFKYRRNQSEKQIGILFDITPNLHLEAGYQSFATNIAGVTLFAKEQDQGRSLEISLDTDKLITRLKREVFIENPQQYQCYTEFQYFLKNEHDFNSDDFNDAKTLRLYELCKQLLALWARGNGMRVAERDRSAMAEGKWNWQQVPIIMDQSQLHVTQTGLESTSAVLAPRNPILHPLSKVDSPVTDFKPSIINGHKQPISKWQSFQQNWLSKKSWSDWWQQPNWWQQQRTKVLGALGLAAVGGAGLYFYSQQKNRGLFNVASPKK